MGFEQMSPAGSAVFPSDHHVSMYFVLPSVTGDITGQSQYLYLFVQGDLLIITDGKIKITQYDVPESSDGGKLARMQLILSGKIPDPFHHFIARFKDQRIGFLS